MNARYLLALLLLAALSSSAALIQIDTERVRPEQDVSDLFARASSSRFVVVGTVAGSKGIGRRMTPELAGRIKAEGDLSLTVGGSLYTIQVESTICREADFKAKARDPANPQPNLYVFLPRTDPMFVDGHAREILLPERRYLLFLSVVRPEERQRLINSFQLDPKDDYYRGE